MIPEDQQSSSQAPELGISSRILGAFHVTGVFWYRFPLWGVRVAPRWLISICLPLFTTFFFLFLRKIRKAVSENLVVVLGKCNWWEKQRRIYRTFWQFAWSHNERYENLLGKEQFYVRSQNIEAWEKISSSKQGFILLTGHIGNWEMGSIKLLTLGNRHIHVVREQELDPRAQKFTENLFREKMGPSYITHFGMGDLRLGKILLEALNQGDLVALQGDRPRRGGQSIAVRMFGHPFEIPKGPFVLARIAQVPILPVFVFREKRFHYTAFLHDPFFVACTSEKNKDLSSGAKHMAKIIETAIWDRPHQWFCFRKLWS